MERTALPIKITLILLITWIYLFNGIFLDTEEISMIKLKPSLLLECRYADAWAKSGIPQNFKLELFQLLREFTVTYYHMDIIPLLTLQWWYKISHITEYS